MDFQALFKLSTNSVDNFVEKSPLTACEARFHAVFNTLLNLASPKKSFKISHLKIIKKAFGNISKNFMLDFFCA